MATEVLPSYLGDSPNATNGIYSTVPAALGKASMAAKFSNAIIDSIFWDIRPEVGSVGKVTNILYPNINQQNPKNIGSGGLSFNTAQQNVAPLLINQKISNSYTLPTEINSLSDVDLMAFYFQGWLEETVRAAGLDMMNVLVNNDAPTPVGSSVVKSTKMPDVVANGGNFQTVITGTGVGHPNRADISQASGGLFQAGVPLDDGQMTALTSGSPYFGMVADPAYSQSYFVGEAAAVEAQQTGRLKMLNGATVIADQNFPIGGTAGAAKYYTMVSHKIAHGGRFIIETPKYNKTTFETFVYPKPGMPIRVSFWYNPLLQAECVSFNVVYGVTVIRPDFRVLIVN